MCTYPCGCPQARGIESDDHDVSAQSAALVRFHPSDTDHHRPKVLAEHGECLNPVEVQHLDCVAAQDLVDLFVGETFAHLRDE